MLFCSQVHFGSEWHTIVGLGLDICGFIIIARSALKIVDSDEQGFKLTRHAELLAEVARRAELNTPPDLGHLKDVYSESLRKRSEQKLGELDRLKVTSFKSEKTSLVSGAFAIVVGFIFQIAGAWPCP